MASTAEVISQTDAARRLGISKQSLGTWVRRPGAPVVSQRGVLHCKWPEFPLWRDAERERQLRSELKPSDMKDAQARKLAAEAELAEIEVQRARGELVAVASYDHALQRIVGTLRAQILSVSGRYAPRLVGLGSLVEVQAALDLAMRDVLQGLADGHSDG